MSLSGSDPALMHARFGVMRFGASRFGHVDPVAMIEVDGVDRTGVVRLRGASVQDILNSTPNTATLRVAGFTPVEGQTVEFGLGGLDAGQLEFSGRILNATQVHETDTPDYVAYDLQCISHEWLLNRRKVTGKYQSTSATAIFQSLIATYTSGFSSVGVTPGLAVLDEITFTNEDVTTCFDRICDRIGSDWEIDHALVLRVPASGGVAHDITDADVHGMRGIAVSVDLSQVRTRGIGEGMGSAASSDIAVGQTTMPLDDTTFASASGGTVVSGPQRITYTSKSTIDGTGSKVGGRTGLAPGIPTATVVAETSGNLSVGAYRYAASLVINGGETEAGNNSSDVSITDVTAPNNAGIPANGGAGSLITGHRYIYAMTYVTSAGETTPGYSEHDLSGGDTAIALTSIPVSSDDRVTARRLYRADTSLGVWRLRATLNTSDTSLTDTTADGSLSSATPPSVNTSGSGRIDLSNIPTGPPGTTARRLYRSPVNVVSNSGYKYLATVSGNVTTTYSDNIADSELGDALPLTSTVGPIAGDTSLPVQELSAFASGGGWVLAANQLIRYTGRSASSGAGTLTGVPASGIGAITAAISYDVVVINAPHLTGVSGILYAITRGDPVNLFVTRNDAAAQTAMAALVGGDGITEEFIQDRRLSQAEMENRLDALLLERKDPIVTVRYLTRDKTTRSGRTVTINLGAPTNISGTFKIQRVSVSGFSANGAFWPQRQVEASSRLFTFQQLLQLVKAA